MEEIPRGVARLDEGDELPETVVRILQEAVQEDGIEHPPDVRMRVAYSRGQLGVGREKDKLGYLSLELGHKVAHPVQPALHVFQQLLGRGWHGLFAIGHFSNPGKKVSYLCCQL